MKAVRPASSKQGDRYQPSPAPAAPPGLATDEGVAGRAAVPERPCDPDQPATTSRPAALSRPAADAQPATAEPPSTTTRSDSAERVPDQPPRRELRGVVERITYENPENGYTIARLSPERPSDETRMIRERADDRLVTVVGTLADITPGEAIIAHGWWRNDPKYGWQFQVADYRTTLPATVQGMKKYLGSGLVKGVGPVMAGRIVDAFGEATFEVVDTSPERLQEVPGIGPVRATRIGATWDEQRHIREVMTALQGYGISTSLAVRIYKRFGDESGRVLTREPYRLAREVWGIGFKTADKIARAVGIAADAPERLQAGVLHALATAAEEGHTLLPEPALARLAATLLACEPDTVAEPVDALLQTGDLIAATQTRETQARQTTTSDTPDTAAGRATTEALPTEALPTEALPKTANKAARATGLAGGGRAAGAAAGGPQRLRTPSDSVHGTLPGYGEGVDTPPRLLALAPFARAESGLASRLRALQAAGNRPERTVALRQFGAVDWLVAFGWLEERHGITLAVEQADAARMALTTPVSLLTGGPGTGKTHTLRAVLTLALAKRLRCLLAAPTGRAAKRMEEATGQAAATLHRVLELRPGGQAGRGQDRPLEADLVVVDEASMLDALLANQLAKAIALGTHLLLVGDPNQLPSVGAGDVLANLLQADQFPVTRLERLFRQGAGSGIARNAARIIAGNLPEFGRGVQDCYFLKTETPDEAAQLVVDLVARRLPERYAFQRGEIQVLAPMHRGAAGVGVLSGALQDRLNPHREGVAELRGGGRTYRPGDRVLQLKNNYDLAVFNGDLGTVTAANPVDQELTVLLDDGREVQFPATNLYELTHAYAMTVHKVQGAEFPAVVIPLLTSHAPMLGRTLLYTAVTRARRLVVLVGQWAALRLAVRDWRREPRHTALGGLLDGSLRFAWPRRETAPVGRAGVSVVESGDDGYSEADWEGLLAAPID